MKRIIAGIVIGMAIVCSVFLGPLTSTSASEEENQIESNDTASITDTGVMVSELKKAGEEITDEEISCYYQLLIDEYNLEESSISVSVENVGSISLPDINNIVRKATSLPLQEAGKNIKDKEIAAFYQEFLEDAGWKFE
jgi:hypothetical protein